MELRPYQREALERIVAACAGERFLLVQAATGAGKTILFSTLVKRFLAEYQMRICIVAHREILVRQAYDKLLKVWPEGFGRIGLACASVSSTVDLRSPVVIGSPQTLTRRLGWGDIPPFHLTIVDEAHRLPPANFPSQYRDLLEIMEERYPENRVLGVTATPFRLGHGYIYGDRCRPDARNWFPALHHQVDIRTLQAQGWLVPYRAKEAADIRPELARVDRSKGEFKLDQLGDLMGREVHLQSAVAAYERFGEGRRHVVIFCVTIEHANRVAAAFTRAGHPCGVVHSLMSGDHRQEVLRSFERGDLAFLANVGVLTEGWDSTAVDCLLMCRPTMSPALYVQIVGRGLRPHPGKDDCLILDLSGNCRLHGDPNDPHVAVPTGGKAEKKELVDRAKACPRCAELVPPALRECPACGYRWPEEVLVEAPPVREMRTTDWSVHGVEAELIQATAFSYLSRKGNLMLMLKLTFQPLDHGMAVVVKDFWDLEGQASKWGQEKARRRWWGWAGSNPPATVEEGEERFAEVILPRRALLRQEERGWWKVQTWLERGGPEPAAVAAGA